MSKIAYIDITEIGKYFFVKYYSGIERSYTADSLPAGARKFLLERKEKPEKMLSYELPVFGTGPRKYEIVSARKYYRVTE